MRKVIFGKSYLVYLVLFALIAIIAIYFIYIWNSFSVGLVELKANDKKWFIQSATEKYIILSNDIVCYESGEAREQFQFGLKDVSRDLGEFCNLSFTDKLVMSKFNTNENGIFIFNSACRLKYMGTIRGIGTASPPQYGCESVAKMRRTTGTMPRNKLFVE